MSISDDDVREEIRLWLEDHADALFDAIATGIAVATAETLRRDRRNG